MSEPSKKSDDIMKYLVDIAVNDGIISDDERNFINVMQNEIENYKSDLTKSLEDGKITINEKLQLVKSKKNMMRKALDTVREDMNITSDEQKLLDGLDEKLKELDTFEKQFFKL